MTQLVFDGLDLDEEGSIGLDEYTDASTSNEVLRMSDVVKFFDDERRKAILERIFDDTNLNSRKVRDATKAKNRMLKELDEEEMIAALHHVNVQERDDHDRDSPSPEKPRRAREITP